MREVITRGLYGAIYVAVVVACIMLHPMATLALMVFLFLGGLTETKHLLKSPIKSPLFLTTAIMGTLLLWAHFTFTQQFQNFLLPFVVVLIFALFVHHTLYKGSENSNQELQNVLLAMLYTLLPVALAISIIYSAGYWQPQYLMAIFIFLWANDTLAYVFGRWLGKHKLLERISPKKTIEGFVGGLLGAAAAGYLVSLFWDQLYAEQWIALAVLVAIAGTIGDLFESSLKRTAGVKDSGTLIPGHGGILDRLDSFYFAVPMAYFYLKFFT